MCKTLLGKFDAVYIINGPNGLKNVTHSRPRFDM